MKVEEFIKRMKKSFHSSEDLVCHVFSVSGVKACAVFIDGFIDRVELEKHVIEPLVKAEEYQFDETSLLSTLTASLPPEKEKSIKKITEKVASGSTAVTFDIGDEIYLFSTRKTPERAVSEPPTSAVIKGPREGFNENCRTNLLLIRRALATPDLVVKTINVGRRSLTSVSVVYVQGIARAGLVQDILKKIKSIDIDGVIDSSYIARFLEARPYSLFKQTGTSEKPDVVASKLLEGRVGIVVDGSPIVLTLPFVMMEDFLAEDDYYKRPIRATFLRTARLLALFFALFLPATLVALEEYQFQMIPLKLLTTILNSAKGIPFTPVVEMLIALVLFEILNEASVRMPRYVGMAMSVVGAIILGETAVKAGILSSVAVLVTALSAIGLYAIPDEVGTFSTLRILYVVVAGTLGLFGLVLAGVATTAYLVTLEVYGTPYLAPVAPVVYHDMEDAFFKKSLVGMKYRPRIFKPEDRRRQK